jgi:hypothetical protein
MVLTWLVFAGAIALGVVAIGDLTANEIHEESVVHRLEVTHATVGSANRPNGGLTPLRQPLKGDRATARPPFTVPG